MNPVTTSSTWQRLALVTGIALVFWCAPSCSAAMSLLFREMFATTGTLTSASPRGFSSLTGTFHQRAGGPRLSGGEAASVDLQGSRSLARYQLGGPEHTKVFAGGWFYLKSLKSSSTILMGLCDMHGNAGPVISDVGGKLGAGVQYLSWTPCPIDPVNRWVYFGIGISRLSGSTADLKFYYRLPGGSMVSWATVSGGNVGIGSIGQFILGAEGNNPATAFRVGAPSVYSFQNADFSDVIYPPDLIEPKGGLTWYCNPAIGNDDNDGTAPDRAWATAAKINMESLHTGMLPANSYAEGDTLVIDTAGADLEISRTGLAFRTAGLNVKAPAQETWIKVKSYRTLSPAAWAPTTVANVYATADTQASIVVWEDDKFMNHPMGADFASVSSALGNTPGSFWTDGTVLYVHPFGSTDPRTDGKRYERSYVFDEGMAVALAAPHLHVRDLSVGKTCLAEKATNDAIHNYCMGMRSYAGTMLIEHCYLYYGAKHNLGLVEGAAGDEIVIDGVQAEQASPYTWAGGQTVFVSFCGGASHLGIVHRYRNCITHANAGLIGSTSGVMTSFYPTFYSHNTEGAGQFAEFEFTNCDFGAGVLSGGAVDRVWFDGGSCGDIAFDADVSLARTFVRGMPSSSSGRTLKARHCIFTLNGILTNHLFAGSADFQGCTFDATEVNSIQGGILEAALISRGGPLSLTFKNNVVLMPPGGALANVFSNLKSTDSLAFQQNAYRLQGSVLSYQYDDGAGVVNCNFSAWQTLGFDTGSFESGNLMLSAAYVPQPNSPLIGSGLDLGPETDFWGRSLSVRNDIGACEAPVTYSYWKVANFSAAELAQPALTDSLASYRSDGVTNLIKYALGLHPESGGANQWPVIMGLKAGPSLTQEVSLRYPRIRDAADVWYVIETSPDLKLWSEGNVVSEKVIWGDSQTEMVESVVSIGMDTLGFFRVRAVQTAP